MNTTGFRKRNVVVLIVTALILSVGAQTKTKITTGMMGGNKLNTTILYYKASIKDVFCVLY